MPTTITFTDKEIKMIFLGLSDVFNRVSSIQDPIACLEQLKFIHSIQHKILFATEKEVEK